MLNVLHVITGLDTGGAETMLQTLIANSGEPRFRHSVVSLTDIGPVGERLTAAGVPVSAVGMRRGSASLPGLMRLRRLFRHERPDVVKSWMYHSDLAASLASLMSGRPPLVWGVHNTTFVPGILKLSSRWTANVCARLSHHVPARIVCDSLTGMRAHIAIGYDAPKMTVIANGFDVVQWKPDASARAAIRAEFGVPSNTFLIGMIARFDPVKGHRDFLEAAALIRRERSDVQFVLCGGSGIDHSNALLVSWIAELGLTDAVYLLGRRDDLPRVAATLDLGISASHSESFPLAVGEIMACAVPCVVTDVGDSGLLVGDGGVSVPPRESHVLAQVCLDLLALPVHERKAMGDRARKRVATHFSITQTVDAYESVFHAAAAWPRGSRSSAS